MWLKRRPPPQTVRHRSRRFRACFQTVRHDVRPACPESGTRLSGSEQSRGGSNREGHVSPRSFVKTPDGTSIGPGPRQHVGHLRESSPHSDCGRPTGSARCLEAPAQGAGHRDRYGDVAGSSRGRPRVSPVRSGADGSELHGRHDVGPRGHRSPRARAGARSPASCRRDDGLGQRRSRSGSDAPRRPGLRTEAVGQHAAPHDAQAGDRCRARAAPAGRGGGDAALGGTQDPAPAAAAGDSADRRMGARRLVAARLGRRR